MDRPAGVCNSEVRAHSADYIDFGCQRGRLVDRDLGGRPAAGLRRSRSPPLDLATLGCEDRDGCNEVPSRRETQLSAYMRSGEDAKEAFKSPGTVLRSSSLPERCFYERCKPSGNFTEVPSALPTNPDWLKTRLAALAEESEFPKVKVRLNRPKNTEIPSPLTGHGERTKCRSPSPRLLGEGVAIGEANKASLGVPWRSLPVYSKGALCQTMITGLSTTRRVQALSEFSEKLNSSTTKELIYPENNGKATEADGHFENWLISVQNSLQSLNIVRAPIPTPRISITRAGSPTLTEKQQQCKPLKKYLESDQGTKDACPFARNDSDSAARETRPPTVHVRIHLTPATSRRTIDVLPGTLIHEKNRTWQFQQDMAEVRNGVTLLSPKNTPRGTMLLKSKDPVLKSGDLSASQSTLEPDQSTRTPLSPLSPIYSSYSTEAARPRWR